jgi:hypothetical protein
MHPLTMIPSPRDALSARAGPQTLAGKAPEASTFLGRCFEPIMIPHDCTFLRAKQLVAQIEGAGFIVDPRSECAEVPRG